MPEQPARWAEPGPALSALLAHASPAEQTRLHALRRDWFARYAPIDAAECAAVEAIVATVWRAERLVALEAEVTARLLDGRPLGELPSLSTLARLRTRLDQERAQAERTLRDLYALRPEVTPLLGRHPARRTWIFARLVDGTIASPFAPKETAAEPAAPAAPDNAAAEPSSEPRAAA
jgi:hypothetical protein